MSGNECIGHGGVRLDIIPLLILPVWYSDSPVLLRYLG